jgi:WD40 repeat protein/serine/threonine protein kinase
MDESNLSGLLARWEEAYLQGRDIAPAELCPGKPELAAELGRCIDLMRSMNRMMGRGPDGNGSRTVPPPQPAGTEAHTLSMPGPGPSTGALPTLTDPTPPAPSPWLSWPVVHGYEIVDELGRGGMGVVYKARHLKLNRTVALKMILLGGHAGAEELARFRTEAEVVASLLHPNIVQIYEVGEHDVGTGPPCPYIALEFCAGGSLAQALAGTPLAPREAAHLVEKLARAVQSAHEAGIVHRDLKPGNVLLSFCGRSQNRADGGPAPVSERPLNETVPKITDFGLAKRLDSAGQTASGAVMGTPSYMAPEQAGGKSKEVGPLADVYALGAILYECLTGRPPFKAATAVDTILQVVGAEAVPPRRLSPTIDRDLETITLKCLEKEPRQRPLSAGFLADELARYLEGRPIRLRPVHPGERLWRWGRRNPVLAAAGGLAGLALLAVLVVSVAFALSERRHSKDLRQALRDSHYRLAENYLDRALTADPRTEPDERLLWLGRSLEAAPADADDLQRAIRLNLTAWHRALHELRAPLPHKAVIRCLAFRGDSLLLAGCADGSARLWDAPTGEPAGKPRALGTVVLAVGFDKGGRALAAVPREETVRVVDVRSGKTVAGPFAHAEKVVAAAFNEDGRLLVTGSADQTARVWNVARNSPVGGPLRQATDVIAVALSADGKRALTGTTGGKAQVWDVASGRPRGPVLPHPRQVLSVAFVPRSEVVVTGCEDNAARRWDGKTGKLLGSPIRHHPAAGTVWAVAVSPDGERLLTCGEDSAARMWGLESGERVGQALTHQEEVRAIAFSPDGRLLATGGYDQVVRLWRAAPRAFVGPLNHPGKALHGVIRPDGRLIATAGTDGMVRLWHTATGRPAGRWRAHENGIHSTTFRRDGRRLLTASAGGSARVWEVPSGRAVGAPLRHAGEVHEATFSPDGRLVATASGDGTAALWNAETGKRLFVLSHENGVQAVVFDPRGTLLWTGGHDRKARLWEVSSGRLKATLPHDDVVRDAAFTPDGRRVVTVGDDRKARVWLVDDPERKPLVLSHDQPVRVVAVSADGRRIVTGSDDHTARVWDADTGDPLTRPLEHALQVLAASLQPGGPLLATGSVDRTARLWEAGLGRPVGPPLGHGDSVTTAVFDPSGRVLLTCAKDGKGRLWPVPAPAEGEAEWIMRWTERVTGKTLDAGGAARFLAVEAWRARR